MAIALVDTGTGQTAVSSDTTFDFTGIDVSGANTFLIVALVHASSSSAPTGATVTWDPAGANQAFGAAVTSQANPSRGMAIYVLKNPTAGAGKTISVSGLNAAAINKCGLVVSLSGVDQTTPNDTPNLVEAGAAQTTTASGTITSPAGDWILSFISGSDATPNWAVTGTGQTIRASVNHGNANCGFADDRDGADDVVTWTHDSTNDSGAITFNLNAAAGSELPFVTVLGGRRL